jgi:hypothetical protein
MRSVLWLYARGLTLTSGDLAAHFAEVYNAQVSEDTISRIIDRVVEEMQAWISRPLDRGLRRGGSGRDQREGPRRPGRQPAGLRRDRG